VYDGDRDYSKSSKYVTDSRWGEVDGKTRLDLGDDAAHDFLGGDWRMPTPEEFQELVDNCIFENVGLNGHTVISMPSVIPSIRFGERHTKHGKTDVPV